MGARRLRKHLEISVNVSEIETPKPSQGGGKPEGGANNKKGETQPPQPSFPQVGEVFML